MKLTFGDLTSKQAPEPTRTCHFSPCREYRYRLDIIWDATRRPQQFIGLNPSTADEFQDDPTIRRCIDFAKRWGAGGLVMTNIFAFRATDPKVMLAHAEPIGEENTIEYLAKVAAASHDLPIAAWGTNGDHLRRGDSIKAAIRLNCLRTNGDGSPQHPLYLPKTLTPRPYGY